MAEHILFLTGKLAEKSLHRVLESMQPTDFTYEVRQLGVSVAALMTTQIIEKRLTDTRHAQKVIIPGRCRGDIESLSKTLNLPVERGPEELKDLPAYFGQADRKADLEKYDVQIFAEIVDAPTMSVADIITRAQKYKEDGANVIDLGCLPSTPFPHLTESVQALKAEGFKVSVDSLTPEDLLTGGKAGADYLLSLSENTLGILDEVESIPILIGNTPSDARSLYRAIDILLKQGRAFIADSILDPIHFGFTESIVRYRNLRKRYPDIEIIMGIGNLTELTHADSAGTNALLLGIISELEIRHYDNGLMALHERKPFPYNIDEVKEFAAEIKDPNFRIQVSDEGVHTYNRDGMHTTTDPYEIYPKLKVEDDGGHAFYLGVEHARAQIAWQLGKRYEQDEELNWGVATNTKSDDLSQFKEAGTTMHTRKTRKDKRAKDKKSKKKT